MAERVRVREITRPTDQGELFSTWSLTKLADHLARRGVVEDISHEDSGRSSVRRVSPFKP
jgi:hypothetical protein